MDLRPGFGLGSRFGFGSRFGLGSHEAVWWALYDWGNAAFSTVVVAVGSPAYGATADHYRAKKPFLGAFVGQPTGSSGSSRYSVVSLLVFFVGGFTRRSRVDVEEGRRTAIAADGHASAGVDAGTDASVPGGGAS